MRVAAIWAFGIIAGLCIGGVVGMMAANTDAGFIGAIGGAALFSCLRLWLTHPR